MKVDSVVYFLLDPGTNCIKIGNSSLKNLSKRISEIQISTPNVLSVMGVMWGGLDVEKALHEQFAESRVRGEWFRADADLLEYIQKSWDFTVYESLDKKLQARLQ